MLPFSVQFVDGKPTAAQLVVAVKKAIISGQMKTGDQFPTIKELGQDLRIHPKIADEVIAQLAMEGFIDQSAGSTLVANAAKLPEEEVLELISADIKTLVKEGKKIGLTDKSIMDAFTKEWKQL